jgi:hypothetical protein
MRKKARFPTTPSILTPDPSPPVERGGSSFPFSTREKGKG